ncbi:MAG: hypothetical protein ACLR4Z_04920 [Butyricicoccaceae bacterium]
MGELEDVNFRGGVLMRRPAVFDIPECSRQDDLELVAYVRH